MDYDELAIKSKLRVASKSHRPVCFARSRLRSSFPLGPGDLLKNAIPSRTFVKDYGQYWAI